MKEDDKMLNKDMVMQYIEMNLGVPYQALELDREEINEIIDKFTLPIFSTYFPHTMEVKVTAKDQIQLGIYRIPQEAFNQSNILGVTKFIPFGSYNTSSLIESGIHEYPLSDSSNFLLNNQFSKGIAGVGAGRVLTNFVADEISIYNSPPTYKFREPNIIEVFPKSNNHTDWYCELRVVHPTHLATIGTSYMEDFLKLCLYDIQVALYPIRARFSNLNTAYGNIELFMDGLSDAKSNRETLLENFRNRFMKSSNRKKIFIY
jgi:hypothetical protein